MACAAPVLFELNTVTAADRTEAWQAMLSASYTHVTVSEGLPLQFEGRIQRRTLGGLSIAECTCDPHAGTRSATLVRREHEPCIGVQVVLGGSETFALNTGNVHLTAGSAVLWSSREAFTYDVHETLRKITLIVPFREFGGRVPLEYLERGRLITSDIGAGAFLCPVVAALTRQFPSTDQSADFAIRRAVIELIVAALVESSERATPLSRSERHLVRVQDYIVAHLPDAELRLCDIAAQTGISLRYLHLLFERSGTSVSAWILNARLERCREALTNPHDLGRSITEIAFEWGFNNTAYFSRAFRRRFGATPSDCRCAVRNRLA